MNGPDISRFMSGFATLAVCLGVLSGCEATPRAEDWTARRGEAYVDALGIVRVKPSVRELPPEPIEFGSRRNTPTGRGETLTEEKPRNSDTKPTEVAAAGGPFGRGNDPARRADPEEGGTEFTEANSGLNELASPSTSSTSTTAPSLRPDPNLPARTNTSADPADRTGGWTIVLSTVSGDGHPKQAQDRLAQLQQRIPELSRARLITTGTRTMIAYGTYESPEDARAQTDLAMVKELQLGTMKPFAMALLGPIPDTTASAQISPYDLRSLRRQYPNMNPLYSLDVAVWVASAQDGFPWPEMKRRAEAYATQLRQNGIEAYFFHNEGRQISSVTVGKFDHRAIDQTSGFFSAEVRAMMEKFPRRLTNGQEVMVKSNPADPNSPMKPQAPQLVQVPRTF